MAHLYKSRLQNYAQKRNIAFPMYACEMQGPPHSRLFKARVTLDGATFEGPEFCTTLKDAEHAAAKVAFMTLSPDGTQEDDCLYKSLLQELAQKKGLVLPVYATNRTGQPHIPCFSSTVEIAGECYVGQEARTKKQAEMNAAKVAFMALTEGGQRTNNGAVVSEIQIMGTSISGSSSSQTVTLDDKDPTLVHTTNKLRTISINDPPTYPVSKEPEKPKGYFGLKNLEDGLYMATTPGEDIEKHTMTMSPGVIDIEKHTMTMSPGVIDIEKHTMTMPPGVIDTEKHTMTMPPGVIHLPQPKPTSNVVNETNLNIMRENLKPPASEAREGSGLEDGLYMATTPGEDIEKHTMTMSPGVIDIEKHTMTMPPGVIDTEKHTMTMPPGVIHLPQPKPTSNVVNETNLNIMRENLKPPASEAREGSGSNGKRNQSFVRVEPVKDSGSAMPQKTKIVIRPHIQGMTYEGPIVFSGDEWVAMKVNVVDEM